MQHLATRFASFKVAFFALLVAMLATPAAFATPTAVDVTDVVAAITLALTPIGLIGAAVLLLLVGIKTYKWIRRAM